MSVGMVTARSTGGARPANRTSAPRIAQVLRDPRLTRAFIPAAAKRAQQSAVVSIARTIAPVIARRFAPFLAAELVYLLVTRTVEPDGFPGWGNFTVSYTVEHGHPQTISPGDIAPNGFSHGTYSPPILRDGLLDLDDGTPIGGFRYWGEFHGLPTAPHLTTPKPLGADWPVEEMFTPIPVGPAAVPRSAATPYRRAPDYAPQVQRSVRWRPRSNLTLVVPLPAPNGRVARDPSFRHNVPRARNDDIKAKPANQFVFAVLKGLANALGEAKEWVDILAEAAGYDHRRSLTPTGRIEPGRFRRITVDKIQYLFFEGGMENIDFELLAELVVENEIEDRIYGALGQLSKHAARSLGLTVGPQTGLVL